MIWRFVLTLAQFQSRGLLQSGGRLQRPLRVAWVAHRKVRWGEVLHPKAKRAYGWSHPTGKDYKDERLTVLEIPPVVSPQTAVQAEIVSGNQK
jgi:hypothetical protein